MSAARPALAAGLLALLAGCGGGGGTNPDAAAVLSTRMGTPMYGSDLLVTLEGRNLDKGVSVAGRGCSSVALSSTSPNVSSPSTAVYVCAGPALGTGQLVFTRQSDGVPLATVDFTVPLPQVTLTLSNGAGVSGDIVLTLEAGKVAATVDNFLAYVKSGFYVDTVFHRLVTDFIVQGGGYAKTLVAGDATLPTLKTVNAPIVLEDNAGLSNLKGTIAMARTGAPNSATSQFFFNLVDNTFLDRQGSTRGYAVFGSITAGTDVLAAIASAPCAPWPAFFGSGDSSACLPSPNLVVTAAVQTR